MYPPIQREIEFFWPLTEQIELDLDYSVCKRPSLTCNSTIGQVLTTNNGTISWAPATQRFTTVIQIPPDNLVFEMEKKPKLLARWMLKLIGISWRMK